MLRTAKDIMGYGIQATDGSIGSVDDFYFDDELWIVRYLVVDTGGWLSGRKVLISPLSVRRPDWSTRMLPVNLTRDQVENSPSIDLQKPVSRMMEDQLHTHYQWAPYWTRMNRPLLQRQMPVAMSTPASLTRVAGGHAATEHEAEPADMNQTNLRSMDEVIGYNIEARDGDIGHVETFIIDDTDWSIMYLVVDTRNWLPGKKVLVALSWITSVNWIDESVDVDLTKESVRNCPEYRPNQPINRAIEKTLYDYYGRPVYW